MGANQVNAFVVLHFIRERAATISVWFFGGALAMYFEAVAIASELRDFPGGGEVLAQSLMPTLEAMRILRWPADRIDTLGGYLTYHNVTLVALFLAMYAAVQGARAVRAREENQTLDVFLGTGLSRSRLLWLNTLGFIITQVFIGAGLGAGTALALWVLDEPGTSGSFITLMAAALCVTPFYGVGVVIAQWTSTARLASGITNILVLVVYVLGNVSGKYDWLGWVPTISPFAYANLSRPLIPGFDTDYGSWVLMVAVTLLLVSAAHSVFAKRDLGEGFSLRKVHHGRHAVARGFVPRGLVGDTLWRQRFGLLAWMLGTASFTGVFVSLMSGILVVWEDMAFVEMFSQSGFGDTPEQQYMALVHEMLPPFLAAFILFQSSRWTSDFVQGRVQVWLATPRGTFSLQRDRLISTVLGALLITVSSLGVSAVGSQLQDVEPDWPALGRVLAMATLLAVAFTSLSQLLVAIMHGRNATQVVSIYLAASWLIVFMAPYLDWPEWVARFSLFQLFGHPYTQWPPNINFVIIVGATIVSSVLVALISKRQAKVH